MRTLAPLCAGPVLVVVPPRAQRYRVALRGLNARLIANPLRDTGLASSLRRGLAQARHCRAALICPVDLPALARRDLIRLLVRWRSAPRRITARDIDGRAGAPLVLPKRLYGAAAAIGGDIGLRAFVAALPADQRALVAMPSAAHDVDTPADLQRARRRRGA